MARTLALLSILALVPGAPPARAEPVEPPPTLRVAVYDSAPFGYVAHGAYGGLMVDIWEDIADELGWTYTYTLTDMDELLTGLRDGRYDVGLGAITITPQREAMVDFSQPVNPSGTGIGVSADELDAFLTFWPPLFAALVRLVGLLLLVLVVSGTLLWLVEGRARGPGEDSTRRISSLGDGLWWAAVTMTTVGYGDKVPQSVVGRLIAMCWMFTSIILVSLFTANASSIFTTLRVESHLRTVQDLRRVRVGAAADSSGAELLEREQIPYEAYPLVDDAIEDLLRGEIEAVVSNVPVLRYLKHTRYHDALAISPEPLVRNSMGIALPDDSPLREDIDTVLLQLITEPKWQHDVYRYLGDDR